MRDDVTGMRADLRELTVTVRASVDQGRDHEIRIRSIERDGASAQEVEQLRKDFAEQLKALRDESGKRITALERFRWGAGGVIAVASVTGSGLIAYLATAR